jgi:hypothetical protein
MEEFSIKMCWCIKQVKTRNTTCLYMVVVAFFSTLLIAHCIITSYRGVFYQNCLKVAPIESKVDCAKLGHSLVFLTMRSCN